MAERLSYVNSRMTAVPRRGNVAMFGVEVDSVPDGNNVYGSVVAPNGMQPVLEVVQRLVGKDNAHIYVSGYNGASTLHFSTQRCDFESTPLDDGSRHLLNGGVAGSAKAVIGFVKELSHHLSDAQIEHSFEVYDESDDLVFEIPD
jgi:hypothetical protein